GCGFTPVYGTNDDYDIEIGTYLASIKVEHHRVSGVLGQQLENALEDRLNPTSKDSLYGTAFRLQFTVVPRQDAAIIEQTGVIQRFNIVLTSNYKLVDAYTGEVLDSGTVRRTASFFNAPEKYAAYVAEKDAVQRALVEMSEDYRLRLASYFAREYKLG